MTMRRSWTLLPFLFTGIVCLLLSTPSLAQYNPGEQRRDHDRDDRERNNDLMYGPGWQVMKATWGSGNRWLDVTYQVRALLSGNGMIKVNNQNMGGDPAVGADKVLHIRARNFEGHQQDFTFKEGSSIDAGQFYNYGSVGSGPGWQVMWAEWGAGNRRSNVTDRVRALLSGNGMVRVNNQNMGGDPAVGADKTLWISARDERGHVQSFTFKEGSNLDASQFYNYGNYPGPGTGYPGGPSYPGGPDYGDLQIVRAFYGLNNQTADVTWRLRSMVQENSLVLPVNNNTMGGDPAVGADKVLTVIYRVNGREQTATVKEGNQLRIP